MTSAGAVVRHVLHALNQSGLEYMVTGSFASNLYMPPRSTQDADFVVDLSDSGSLRSLLALLGDDFTCEAQVLFETVTMTQFYRLHHASGLLKVELFELTDDAHDQARFARRIKDDMDGEVAFVPTPEDVLIQKIRWHRAKDVEDARLVVRTMKSDLDWPYIERWCAEHDTVEILNQVRTEAGL